MNTTELLMRRIECQKGEKNIENSFVEIHQISRYFSITLVYQVFEVFCSSIRTDIGCSAFFLQHFLLFQDVYLYGIFTFLNGALGLMILVLHSSSNQTVRAVLTKAWNQIVKKE